MRKNKSFLDLNSGGNFLGAFAWVLERETGIEPATNGLGSRDSTTELLPLPCRLYRTAAENPVIRGFFHAAYGSKALLSVKS